jgi:hypothetical protein
MKKCGGICDLEKEDDQFSPGEFAEKWGQCRECVKAYNKQYRAEHKDEIALQRKEYNLLNKEKIALYNKTVYDADPEKCKAQHKKWYLENKDRVAANWQIYYQNNRDALLAYASQRRQDNKEAISKKANIYVMNKYRTDPVFKLRRNISTTINKMLNSQGETKRGASIMQYLDWSIEELFNHLENLFSRPSNLTPDGKVWMNWTNRGVYNLETWDDNDPNTWIWHLDHIVPKSMTPYSSMADENFRKTWALSNLRPLSAKQNILEGNRREGTVDGK